MALRLVVLGLVVVSGIGCGERSCPGGCPEYALATFNLSCSPNDLTSVEASGPCSMPDAGLSWYTGTNTKWIVAVGSSGPGTCHITLTFATGFTYSRDVTFSSQTREAGCCPAFLGPTPSGFTVNNPSDTCVDAGS